MSQESEQAQEACKLWDKYARKVFETNKDVPYLSPVHFYKAAIKAEIEKSGNMYFEGEFIPESCSIFKAHILSLLDTVKPL